MESVLNFEPLWSVRPLINQPDHEIEKLRLQVLKRSLEVFHPYKSNQASSFDMLDQIKNAVEALFSTKDLDNTILLYIQHQACQYFITPAVFIEAMISLWYISAIPILLRDPNIGVAVESDPTYINGQLVEDLDIEESTSRQYYANLGILSMVLGAKNWRAPRDSNLHAATLVANSTTSMIFTAFIIGSKRKDDSWRTMSVTDSSPEIIKTFLKSSWQVARQGDVNFEHGPGREFGAKDDEVQLSYTGKRLLSRIGRNDTGWYEPPYWHPCKRVPGSPWNKFFKNKDRPVFQVHDTHSSSLAYRFPSTAMKLVIPFENYYSQLKFRMDSAGHVRRIPDDVAEKVKYNELATGSGHWYPSKIINENNAMEVYDALQEYKYALPMVKRPTSDLRNHATFPFLSSASRALRFEIEPLEIEDPLIVMVFGGLENSNDAN